LEAHPGDVLEVDLEAKTACLAILLRDGGARVAVTGSNPLSTQDDVAQALAGEDGIAVYARHGVSAAEYTDHLRQALAERPDLVLDDGGDLVQVLHEEGTSGVLGGCEETTTGGALLEARACGSSPAMLR
jgi:adenosylhomocysteinase